MYETLSTYLSTSATREQSAMILGACYELSNAGFDDLESKIEQEFLIYEQVGDDLIVALVNGLLIPTYQKVLQEFGITLNPEAQLPICTSILQATRALDNWGDPEALLDVISIDDAPEDRYCAALAITGQHSVEEYLAAIDSVSEELLARLMTVVETAISNLVSEPASEHRKEAVRIAVLRVRALTSFMEPQQYSLLSEHLADNLPLGAGPSIINQYADRISKLSSTQMADELFALLAATEIETATITRHVLYLLEQLEVNAIEFNSIQRRLSQYNDKLKAAVGAQ